MNIEQQIGYEFKNKRLLEQALTPPVLQKKKLSKAFERLEFLGDRVLGLVIAEALYCGFPNSNEGELAKRMGYLTSRDFCHKIAIKIDLAKYINTHESNLKGTSVLSNTVESIIAAIYIDSGLESVQKFIYKFWQEAFEKIEEMPKDSKSVLQETMQKKGLGVPLYTEVKRFGPDHAPEYEIKVSIDSGESATGRGKNKKIAEQESAKNLLKIITNNL